MFTYAFDERKTWVFKLLKVLKNKILRNSLDHFGTPWFSMELKGQHSNSKNPKKLRDPACRNINRKILEDFGRG